MPLDDLVLGLQRFVDRVIRRARRGRAPTPGRRRLLVVQIDGLSRGVLELALAQGRLPFLRRVIERGGWRLHPMFVGLPSSTPAFQMAAMYGVRPDIPGFHYHEKRHREDVYFPRAGDAARVERAQAAGRRGILEGGASYGCVFTGGADDNLFTFANMKRPSGTGLVAALSALIVLAWVALKSTVITAVELARAVLRLLADPVGEWRRGFKWLAIKVGLSVWVRELFTLAVSRDIYAGAPAIYVNYLDYDVMSHAYGPRHGRALRSLRRLDDSIKQIWRVCRRGRPPLRARRLRGFLHDAGGAAGGSRAPGRAPSPRQRHQGPAHGPRTRVLPALLQLHRGRLSVGARRAEGVARARQRPRHRGGPERVHLLRGRRRAAANRPHREALAGAGRGSVAASRRRVRLRAERRRAAVLLARQALAAQCRRTRSVRRPSGRGAGRRRHRRPHGHAERRRLRRLRHRRRA